MGRDDWYRSEVWNEEIEHAFEVKFKRVRCPVCKVQYLHIQACCLFHSQDDKTQKTGLRIMERVFEEFPDQLFAHIDAWRSLGRYYMRVKDYSNAEIYLKKVIEACTIHKQYAGSVAYTDLDIVDIILATNKTNRFEEAYTMLQSFSTAFRSDTFFNDALFRYYDLSARLCFSMKKMSEAKQWADRALGLAQIKEPQLPHHPTVGLVDASNEQIGVLEQIVGTK